MLVKRGLTVPHMPYSVCLITLICTNIPRKTFIFTVNLLPEVFEALIPKECWKLLRLNSIATKPKEKNNQNAEGFKWKTSLQTFTSAWKIALKYNDGLCRPQSRPVPAVKSSHPHTCTLYTA